MRFRTAFLLATLGARGILHVAGFFLFLGVMIYLFALVLR